MSNIADKKAKMNGGVEPAQSSKNWWESQGFLLSVVMVGGSAFGLSESVAQSAIGATIGAVSGLSFVFQFLKTSKFKGWLQVVKDGNSLQYLVGALGFFIPNASAIFPSLQSFVDALWSKNLGMIVSAAVSLAVAAYNIFKKNGASLKATVEAVQ